MIIKLKRPFVIEVKALFQDIISNRKNIATEKTKEIMSVLVEKLNGTSFYTDQEIRLLQLSARTMEVECFDNKAMVNSCRHLLVDTGYYRESDPDENPVFYLGPRKKSNGYLKA